jgi:peptidoglycan/xylan/chitin deacetylase (PgdA/CDA1 family)
MIRGLPKGVFDAYALAHQLNGKGGLLPRFAMGVGAIFMIQRVRPADTCLAASTLAEVTDPALLGQMLSLIAVQRLKAVPIGEVRQHLLNGNRHERFVSFSFDGAYRGILDNVYPLFRERNIPFTVYVGTDFLDTGKVPWWIALEAMIRGNDRLIMDLEGLTDMVICQTLEEKQTAYATLLDHFAKIDSEERMSGIYSECIDHGVDIAFLSRREMLSAAELKTLAADKLVTIGSLAGGMHPLSTMDFDGARENIFQSLSKLEAEIGYRPRHLAFPGGYAANVSERDIKIAEIFDLDSAVTPVEGALWPEHAAERFALPRIALDNDPATLMRALLLSGDYEAHQRAVG